MCARVIDLKISDALTDAQQKTIQEAILAGKILIFPTDTVYGLGCNAFIADAVLRIAKIKGRAGSHPFSIHLGEVAEVEKYAKLTSRQRDFLTKLLPGPYTLLLEASASAPKPCIASDGKIGIRVPRSLSFSRIYETAREPLVGTSVNISGEPPLTEISKISEVFSEEVELILTSDEPMSHQSSSVIDLTSQPPRAIRGSIPKDIANS